MECPHLVMYDLFYCVSNDEAYRPAAHHMKKYCSGRAHKDCHFFKAFMESREIFSYSVS